MGKRKRVSFSQQNLTIEQIADYYQDTEGALNLFYSFNFNTEDIPAKFLGYSATEVNDELKQRKEALDRTCSMELLAALEARIRIDYLVRCQDKHKDTLSRKLRDIHKTKENRASLVDDIITTWKTEKPYHKNRLDNLGKALDYRNWLAHGRYWQPKKHPHTALFDYLTIYSLAVDILTNLELVEPN